MNGAPQAPPPRTAHSPRALLQARCVSWFPSAAAILYLLSRKEKEVTIAPPQRLLTRWFELPMNKQEFLARRDYFNLVHGITVRAIDAFTDEELDFRPQPAMRTPREL